MRRHVANLRRLETRDEPVRLMRGRDFAERRVGEKDGRGKRAARGGEEGESALLGEVLFSQNARTNTQAYARERSLGVGACIHVYIYVCMCARARTPLYVGLIFGEGKLWESTSNE